MTALILNLKKATKGVKVTIDFGHKKATFTAGGRKRVLCEPDSHSQGFVMVNGIVRFADGTEAYALLEIDETSSGEHHGTGIFLPYAITFQGDNDFLAKLGKTHEQVFPYSYKYTPQLNCYDHHVDDNGWS